MPFIPSMIDAVLYLNWNRNKTNLKFQHETTSTSSSISEPSLQKIMLFSSCFFFLLVFQNFKAIKSSLYPNFITEFLMQRSLPKISQVIYEKQGKLKAGPAETRHANLWASNQESSDIKLKYREGRWNCHILIITNHGKQIILLDGWLNNIRKQKVISTRHTFRKHSPVPTHLQFDTSAADTSHVYFHFFFDKSSASVFDKLYSTCLLNELQKEMIHKLQNDNPINNHKWWHAKHHYKLHIKSQNSLCINL